MFVALEFDKNISIFWQKRTFKFKSFLLQSMFFAFKSNFYIGKALEFLLKSIAKAFSTLKRTLLYKANAILRPGNTTSKVVINSSSSQLQCAEREYG